MADLKQEVTPPMGPPAPLNRNPAPFSFRVDGIVLTQSGGRLIVVNYFIRRMFIWLLCIFLLLPFTFCTYPNIPSHHATWRAMLTAVLATCRDVCMFDLPFFYMSAIFYWLLVAGGDFNGIVLNRRNGTAKAAGRTRSLTDVEAVRVIATRIAGQPSPSGRRWGVRLLWSDEQNLLGWQKLLPYKAPETSFLGYFPNEADADRIAKAIAEFAGIPVHHQTFG